MADRRLPNDEIIDLTDRRRVLLHVLLGVDVEADDADAVFDGELRPRPCRPVLAVDGGYFAVEDHSPPTA